METIGLRLPELLSRLHPGNVVLFIRIKSSCNAFCQSQCVDPFLKYLSACQVDTLNIRRYCATSRTQSNTLCCSLITLANGSTLNNFYNTCNSSQCPSTCQTTYNQYGCCLANLNAATGGTFNGWSTCSRISNPGECYYGLGGQLSVDVIIGICFAVFGGVILLGVLPLLCCICCTCCGVCGSVGCLSLFSRR